MREDIPLRYSFSRDINSSRPLKSCCTEGYSAVGSKSRFTAKLFALQFSMAGMD